MQRASNAHQRFGVLDEAPIENLTAQEVPPLDHTAVHALDDVSKNRYKAIVVGFAWIQLGLGLRLVVALELRNLCFLHV